MPVTELRPQVLVLLNLEKKHVCVWCRCLLPLFNCSLWLFQVCNGSAAEPYTNPRAPVHIITGSAVRHCPVFLFLLLIGVPRGARLLKIWNNDLSSQLAEPLWIDPRLNSGISVHDLISTLKKTKKKSSSMELIVEHSPKILASEEKKDTTSDEIIKR